METINYRDEAESLRRELDNCKDTLHNIDGCNRRLEQRERDLMKQLRDANEEIHELKCGKSFLDGQIEAYQNCLRLKFGSI